MKPLLAFCLTCTVTSPVFASRDYYHLDRLGSVQMVTDQSGAVVESNVHQPYGTELAYAPDGSRLLLPTSDFGFTGHRSVDASGLIYMNARYYDPGLGLFVSHDPARQFPNPYSYGDGDPLNGGDPTGREFNLSAGHQQTLDQSPESGSLTSTAPFVQAPLILFDWRDIGGFELDPGSDPDRYTQETLDLYASELTRAAETPHGQLLLRNAKEEGLTFRFIFTDQQNTGQLAMVGDDGTLRLLNIVAINLDEIETRTLRNTVDGSVRQSLARILGHELGHVLSNDGDDGPFNLNNTVRNENPIAAQLNPSEPEAISYP